MSDDNNNNIVNNNLDYNQQLNNSPNKTFNQLIANATGNPFSLTQSEDEELANLIALELLTPRQQAFCQAYVKCFNAAKAASDAGYSATVCASIGYALLKRPEVQSYIESLRQIESHKYKYTILDQLSDLYQQTKQGDIQYTYKKDDDGNTIAVPIMRQNPDGTFTPHRDKPQYKIALDALKTMAEYTLPKPQDPVQDKLAVANKYIQNNTYINNDSKQSKLIKDHISKVIDNNPNPNNK